MVSLLLGVLTQTIGETIFLLTKNLEDVAVPHIQYEIQSCPISFISKDGNVIYPHGNLILIYSSYNILSHININVYIYMYIYIYGWCVLKKQATPEFHHVISCFIIFSWFKTSFSNVHHGFLLDKPPAFKSWGPDAHGLHCASEKFSSTPCLGEELAGIFSKKKPAGQTQISISCHAFSC